MTKLFDLWKYTREDGSFDYERYREVQIAAYRAKANCVWASQENIRFASSLIRQRLGNVNFGICHGTRAGYEQAWFAEELNCDVIGTEISPDAASTARTIVWDFHETNPDWHSQADFIYSNSFDHAYDPEKCLRAWFDALKPKGMLILEHTSGHTNSKETDPLGVRIEVLPYLILLWSKGQYSVRDIVRAPGESAFGQLKYEVSFLLIQKNL